ncbi:Gfo/Idh/MocA family protein [Lyngbya confervoides]|uniref:Gfo/Idh/MocA family oxidoreductase n=1 Tax=Lyngbya confervoides BDU141951 TaxID=1574623 RepID=A0ABD4T6U3_9CYAN|nr:Gfo/Idh/MocA family oxidoreductase [Lyngbya confervoides]MCM1984195.1 Gfo/Idh/MocA family oxidoreductase [Lyngbya confervoides BDU141951]
MSASDTFGIALVGTGFGQKVHLPAIGDTRQGSVVAVYHRHRAQAEAIAAQHQIPHASDRLEEILALPAVQGVSLSTPPFLHYEMARKVLNAKKHLFLEKPMTLELNEAKALYTLAQHQQVTAALNFEFRFVPAWMQLKAYLDQGYVGHLRLIHINWLVPGRADAQRPWSWHACAAMGGGSLGALGSHSFDYIHWLFGPVKSLSARLSTTVPQRPDPQTGSLKTVDAEDTCTLILSLEDGPVCQVNISATTYAGRGHWVEIYGDRGTLRLGSDNLQDYVHGFQLWGCQQDAPLQVLPVDSRFEFATTHTDGRIAPVSRVFQAWIDAAIQGQPLIPGLREGVYSQMLMDRARQADATSSWVEVPALAAIL